LYLHEHEVGVLPLTLPPFANFSWTADDVLNVLPKGLMLAFVSSANLLLTSRAVEHFQGKHKHLKRSDADAELGAYGIANLTVGIFGAPMSIGIPARSVANVRCGGTTRVSNLMHGVFLFLMVSMGAGVLAHIPMAALAGVTAWMGICLLDVSTWRRLPKMRLTDASAFLVTAIGVLIVNAVAAVMAGCAIYLGHYLFIRFVRPTNTVQGVPSIAK
jgi:MFS superfamily sulfate permease-like transporter